jgi:hypothetical protein
LPTAIPAMRWTRVRAESRPERRAFFARAESAFRATLNAHDQDRLSAGRAVRPAHRIARLLVAVGRRRRLPGGGPRLARRISAADLRMRRLRALRAPGARGRAHGGVAGQRGRCAADALARACAVERRAGSARCLAGPDQARSRHQLLAAARAAGGGTIEHAVGLRRHRRDGRLLQARSAALPSRARAHRRAGERCGLRRRFRLRPHRHRRRRPAQLLAQSHRARASRARTARGFRIGDARSSHSVAGGGLA